MSHRSHPPPLASPRLPQATAQNASRPEVSFAPSTWQPAANKPVSRPTSRTASRESSTAKKSNSNGHASGKGAALDDSDSFSDLGSDDDEMGERRPAFHRPTEGRSHQPLLHGKDDEERGRLGYDDPEPAERPPLFTRRSTMRSRSPDTQAKLATRKKYTYAAFFLGLSLVTFVIQTETAVYIQHDLGWNKAYCML